MGTIIFIIGVTFHICIEVFESIIFAIVFILGVACSFGFCIYLAVEFDFCVSFGISFAIIE